MNIFEISFTNSSQGNFNLSQLPDAPILSSQFQCLPTILPPNEAKRLDLSAKFEHAWDCWGEEKAIACIQSVLETVGTQFASISCFDNEFECLKVVTIEGAKNIPRKISIAAHALLTSDPMVILDTHSVRQTHPSLFLLLMLIGLALQRQSPCQR